MDSFQSKTKDTVGDLLDIYLGGESKVIHRDEIYRPEPIRNKFLWIEPIRCHGEMTI